MAVRAAQVAARKQMLVDPHRSLVFTPTPKQVAEREVQFRSVGVILNRLDECVDGLILLLVKQKI